MQKAKSAAQPEGRRTVAVVLCAGQGRRMAHAQNKVFLPLAGKPLLAHTLAAFDRAAEVQEVLLIAHPDELEQCRRLVADHKVARVIGISPGGATRHQSEEAALGVLRDAIESGTVDVVLIHDGARPLVRPAEIDTLTRAARIYGGALLATPLGSEETIAQLDDDGMLVDALPPSDLWRAQTPQGFDARELLRAYDAARADGFAGTDTAASYERLGHGVRIVAGSSENFKVTTPDDLLRAEAVLAGPRR
jgi:2-C-methyl-D-erythritol 4-phosphate cytidylyltransferase